MTLSKYDISLVFWSLFLQIVFSLPTALSQTPGDQLIGEYWTQNEEGKIAIERKGDQYQGKIIWRKEPRNDTKNPNPELRSRSVIGLIFLSGFTYNPLEKIWEGGSVYAIDNGGTYQGKLWFIDEGSTLKMRGYWGIPLLGRTATLKKVE